MFCFCVQETGKWDNGETKMQVCVCVCASAFTVLFVFLMSCWCLTRGSTAWIPIKKGKVQNATEISSVQDNNSTHIKHKQTHTFICWPLTLKIILPIMRRNKQALGVSKFCTHICTLKDGKNTSVTNTHRQLESRWGVSQCPWIELRV